MKEKNKAKFTLASDLVEKAQQIRSEMQAKGKANIAVSEIFEAIIRQAFNKGSEISINKVWTFEKAYLALKKTSETSQCFEELTKEKLRTLWKFFEDRAKETEAAIEEQGASPIGAADLAQRKPRPKKLKPSTGGSSTTGESTGESVSSDSLPLLDNTAAKSS